MQHMILALMLGFPGCFADLFTAPYFFDTSSRRAMVLLAESDRIHIFGLPADDLDDLHLISR